MKKSRDWVLQEDLDAKLDEFVEANGKLPPEMPIVQVAERLGVTPNGKFYKHFRDWKKRREDEASLLKLDIPTEGEAALRSILADHTESVVKAVASIVNAVAADFDRTASLRIRDAEKRLAESQAEIDELLERWTQTECKLQAETTKNSRLTKKLDKALTELEQVYGRLLEQGVQMDRLVCSMAGSTGPAPSKVFKAEETGDTAREQCTRDAKSPEDTLKAAAEQTARARASEPLSAEPEAEEPLGSDKSSTSDADGPKVHQAELSLVGKDNADQAEAFHDEND